MAGAIVAWLIAIPLLGLANGLRTFTPITVLCWFAWRGGLPMDGTWAAWTLRLPVALVLTVFALGEFVGDKLPRTPNRTAPGPLAARLIFGALTGSICATAMRGPIWQGALLGALGALVGAFAGFTIRRDIVHKLGCPDWPIALVEDACAVLASMFAMHIISG